MSKVYISQPSQITLITFTNKPTNLNNPYFFALRWGHPCPKFSSDGWCGIGEYYYWVRWWEWGIIIFWVRGRWNWSLHDLSNPSRSPRYVYYMYIYIYIYSSLSLSLSLLPFSLSKCLYRSCKHIAHISVNNNNNNNFKIFVFCIFPAIKVPVVGTSRPGSEKMSWEWQALEVHWWLLSLMRVLSR